MQKVTSELTAEIQLEKAIFSQEGIIDVRKHNWRKK